MTAAWQEMRLSDCCEFISDGDHQAPPKADTGVPFITISNISNNRLDFTNTAFVPESYYNALDYKRRAQTGDILYSVVGSFGIPVLIRQALKFTFQRHIAILRPNKHTVPAFLYYLMLSSAFYQQADTVAIGAAQRTISLTALRNMTVKIPSLAIQQKIASILSAYDDLIDNNQQQIKLLEEAVKLYLLNFFKENNSNHWTNYAFPEVFDVIRGRSYKSADIASSTGKLFVNLKNIKAWGGYKRNAEKRYSGEFQHCQTLLPGDLIMGMTDMTQDRRLVGHVAKVPHLNEEAIFSMDIAKIVPKVGTANYLYYYLQYSDVSTSIANLANGANVLHLRQESLKSIMLKLPSDELIAKFDTLTSPIATQIELLEDCNQLLQEARDRLLPKLLSGEIEV